MAKLTYAARKKLPASSFVFPAEREYPINDESHARNALARVSQHGSEAQKARVRAKVRRKYPSIAVEGESAKPRGDRASRKK